MMARSRAIEATRSAVVGASGETSTVVTPEAASAVSRSRTKPTGPTSAVSRTRSSGTAATASARRPLRYRSWIRVASGP